MGTTLEKPKDTAELAGKAVVEAIGDLEGKYLTFLLADDEYGLNILRVREIIGIVGIIKVPQTPDFVQGVINLRGKVIPVVDLRLRFGLPNKAYDDQTCIIVVDLGMLMGIIVDTVLEVHAIPAIDIEPPPEFGAVIDPGFILGRSKVDGDVKILLDIEKVLTTEELEQVPLVSSAW